MSKDFEEEVFAPRSATHFSANRVIGRMHSQDVLGKTADDGEVFRPVVFAGASGVLVEHNVEDPVQLVLDAPMSTHDFGQFVRGELARERDISRVGLGLAVRHGALGFETAERRRHAEGDRPRVLICGDIYDGENSPFNRMNRPLISRIFHAKHKADVNDGPSNEAGSR